jgi:hypothetical protein
VKKMSRLSIFVIGVLLAAACGKHGPSESEKAQPNDVQTQVQNPDLQDEFDLRATSPSDASDSELIAAKETDGVIQYVTALSLPEMARVDAPKVTDNERLQYFVSWRCPSAIDKIKNAKGIATNLYNKDLVDGLCDSKVLKIYPAKLIQADASGLGFQKQTTIVLRPDSTVSAYEISTSDGMIHQERTVRRAEIDAKQRRIEEYQSRYVHNVEVTDTTTSTKYEISFDRKAGFVSRDLVSTGYKANTRLEVHQENHPAKKALLTGLIAPAQTSCRITLYGTSQKVKSTVLLKRPCFLGSFN